MEKTKAPVTDKRRPLALLAALLALVLALAAPLGDPVTAFAEGDATDDGALTSEITPSSEVMPSSAETTSTEATTDGDEEVDVTSGDAETNVAPVSNEPSAQAASTAQSESSVACLTNADGTVVGYYDTVQGALNAVSVAGQKITLLKSVTENLTYNALKTLTLDLKGYTITGASTDAPTIKREANSGSALTITDTSEGDTKGAIISTSTTQPAIFVGAPITLSGNIAVQGGMNNVNVGGEYASKSSVCKFTVYDAHLSGSTTAAIHIEQNVKPVLSFYGGTVVADGYGIYLEGGYVKVGGANPEAKSSNVINFTCGNSIFKIDAGSTSQNEIYRGNFTVTGDVDVFEVAAGAKFRVSGTNAPTFNKEFDETAYLYDDYHLVQDDDTGRYVVSAITPAKVIRPDGTTTEYPSLTRALDVAKDGDTVQLMGDLETAAAIAINDSITLDLGGHTLSSTTAAITLTIGNKAGDTPIKVKVTNGTVSNSAKGSDVSANAAIAVRNKAQVTLEGTSDSQVTVQATQGTGHPRGVWLGTLYGLYNKPSDSYGGPTLTIGANATVTGDECGVFMSANSKLNGAEGGTPTSLVVDGGSVSGGKFGISSYHINDGTAITVKDGTVQSTSGTAIFCPQVCDLSIEGGTVTGKNGVQVSGGGSLKIIGGNIKATGEAATDPKPETLGAGNVDAPYADGAAVSVVKRDFSNSSFDIDIDNSTLIVSITGGMLESVNNAAVREYQAGRNIVGGTDTLVESMTIAGENLTVKGASGSSAIQLSKLTEANAQNVVSGGWFSEKVSQENCAPGYQPVETPSTAEATQGLYTVQPITYTITYNLADGNLPEGKTNPDTYNVTDTPLTLVAPVREGYIFSCWMLSVDGADAVADNGTIAKGSIGNRSYTAQWISAASAAKVTASDGTVTAYEDFAAALAALGENGTLTLLKDVTNKEYDKAKEIPINLPAGAMLDGNGHTIEGNVAVHVNGAGGTVTNVKFKDIHNNVLTPDSNDTLPGDLCAIYAPDLTGKLVVTDCEFDNCDWDALQITPKTGADITITGNTFRTNNDDGWNKQARYVHIEASSKTSNKTNYSATVTENKMYGELVGVNNSGEQCGPLEVHRFSDRANVTVNYNFIEHPEGNSVREGTTNVGEMVYPMYADATMNKDNVIVPVAAIKGKIEGTYYTDLATAFNEVADGQTITLLEDATGTNALTIAEGMSVTLNPNGKGLANPITNNGTLTISSSADAVKSGTITNNGILNFNGNSAAGFSVDNKSGATLSITKGAKYSGTIKSNEGTVVISGGTFVEKPKEDYLAEWYTANQQTSGSDKSLYKVEKMTLEQAVEKGAVVSSKTTGGNYYRSIADAVKANEVSVVLLKDVNELVEVTTMTKRSVGFNANGHKLSGSIKLNTSYSGTSAKFITLDASTAGSSIELSSVEFNGIVNAKGTASVEGVKADAVNANEGATLTVKSANVSDVTVSKNATLNLGGGNVTGAVKVEDGATLSITGGTFASNTVTAGGAAVPLNTYVDEGYEVVEQADGDTTVYVVQQKTAKLYGATLTLDGRIGVNFYVDMEGVSSPDSYKMKLTVAGATTEAQYDVSATNTFNGKTYHRFTCLVDSRQMTEQISAQLYNGDAAASKAYTYSVKTYADNMLGRDTTSEALKELLRAMLNYGGYAQAHFSYNQDSLANAGLWADGQDPVTTATVPDTYGKTAEGTLPDDITNVGATLLLGSQTTVRVYFTLDAAQDVSTYTFTANGQTVSPVECNSANGTHYIEVDNIPSTCLGDMIEFKIAKGDAAYTVKYGPLTYAYDMANGEDADLANLARALYLYSVASTSYSASVAQ